MEQYINTALLEAHLAIDSLIANKSLISNIALAAGDMANAFLGGGRVFSCGNGGSCCDAMHFAEELSGRFRKDRIALPAVAISDPGHITCVGNDFGFEFIFSRYLLAHAKANDILLAISTSGSSVNVVNAAKEAKQINMKVVALTGRENSALGKLADYELCVTAGEFADRVQELHIKIIHILIELIERQMFPENY